MIDPLLYELEFAFTAIVICQVVTPTTMSPIIICLGGAISWLSIGLWLRTLKVRSESSAYCGHLSLEERQHRIRIATWIFFGGACVFVVGGAFIAWLQTAGR
jgi:hypothetical protein